VSDFTGDSFMALRTVGPNELEHWRSLLLAAARDLGKTRAQLHVSDLASVELSAGRAVQSIEFIRRWAADIEAKTRSRKLDAYLSGAGK
jgi:hypothetical protein